MFRWLYALPHLLAEAGAARRDARIRFLKGQIDILRRKLGGNRVIPSPDDRSKLLAIGAELRHDIADVIGIVAPRTYCRWVEEQREGRQPRSVGRPPVKKNVIELVKRLARENAGWGYARIVGKLRKLRVRLSLTSVRTILRSGGFPTSPSRGGKGDETVWRKFLRLHMNTLVACDFFTKEMITPLGVRVAWFLAFVHVGTRKVYLSPPTLYPHERWVEQQTRNVMMWMDDNELKAEFVVHERDTKFSFAFDRKFYSAGIKRVRTPLLAPDANAFVEAWIGTIKRECLNHFICFGLRHLEFIAQTFVRFYNTHRPHRGVGNAILDEGGMGPHQIRMDDDVGRIRCERFLGGLLRHYCRDAA
jgi:putative transposase